jgi:hypothetical protein
MRAETEIDREGRTHALMREVNDRIRELAALTESDRIAFFCECADPLCSETLRVSVLEYDAARAHSSLVLVRPGHRISGFRHVVEETGRFAIVETLGSTARLLRGAG